jgi:alpha-glucosidase
VRYWPAYAGRDGMRTPMPWRNVDGGGFTAEGVEPWLPFGDLAAGNVEDQRGDPDSLLSLVRDLIALRRSTPELHAGAYGTIPTDADTWAWSRGEQWVVVVNMGPTAATVDGITGRVRLSTDRSRDGSFVEGTLPVAGWEAAVVERSDGPVRPPRR